MSPVSVRVAHVATIDLSLRYLLLNQLQTIQQQGYQVYGLSAPGPTVPELERAGIRFIPIPFVRATNLKPFHDLRAFLELVRVFRRERFTIVHTHTAKPDLYATWAARLAGVPIVITTLHGFLAHELMPPFWRRFYMALAKIGMIAVDSVLSQNDEDLETAAREKICPPEKIKFLGNGIDVRRFDSAGVDEVTRAKLRAEFNIPPNAPIVGFVGRLVRDKGVIELLQAAQKIRAEFPNARFLFIGMMDRAKQDVMTPERAKEYGVRDACIFTGHREDMPELYALMDVFVLPSHREAFPRAPMEASSMGVPCIVTNVRGSRSAVKDGENGLLVPRGDVDALARAITELLQDKTRAREMGARGRRIALERFDERLVFEKVLNEYAYWLEIKGIARKGSPAVASRAAIEVERDRGREPDSRISAVLASHENALPWQHKRVERALKRVVDFLSAFILLVPLTPILLVTAMLVRLTSPGPILLAQWRLGLYGLPFKMYKFRSMRADTADGLARGSGEVPSTDARLTPIGGWLRAWRLDELPQLWHVFIGEMSLVGPRPDLPSNLEYYSPQQMLRFAMPQGCTAWTFTRGAFDNNWSTRQNINVEYVERWSFALDLQIIFDSGLVLLKQQATSPTTNAPPISDSSQ